jgi:hypothetical protein
MPFGNGRGQRSYRFDVLEDDNTWGPFSGEFKSEDGAMSWYRDWGDFWHRWRGGYTLGLFVKNRLERVFSPAGELLEFEGLPTVAGRRRKGKNKHTRKRHYLNNYRNPKKEKV